MFSLQNTLCIFFGPRRSRKGSYGSVWFCARHVVTACKWAFILRFTDAWTGSGGPDITAWDTSKFSSNVQQGNTCTHNLFSNFHPLSVVMSMIDLIWSCTQRISVCSVCTPSFGLGGKILGFGGFDNVSQLVRQSKVTRFLRKILIWP